MKAPWDVLENLRRSSFSIVLALAIVELPSLAQAQESYTVSILDTERVFPGTTLMSAADRIVEIAPNGDIIWQMHAPKTGNSGKKFRKAIRLGMDGGAYGG